MSGVVFELGLLFFQNGFLTGVLLVFERKLALLVTLQEESIWEGKDAVSRYFQGKSLLSLRTYLALVSPSLEGSPSPGPGGGASLGGPSPGVGLAQGILSHFI